MALKESSKTHRQTFQRTRPAPDTLTGWLRAANETPERASVFRSVEAFNAAAGPLLLKALAQFHGGASAERRWILSFLKGLEAEGWGPSALQFLKEGLNSALPTGVIVPRMLILVDLRDFFEIIAKADRSTDNRWLPLPPGPAAGLRIEQGRIRMQPARFLQDLEGVEVERIRKCPVCGLFFWAGRLDKVGCSEPCSRILRLRRLRANRAYNKTKRRK